MKQSTPDTHTELIRTATALRGHFGTVLAFSFFCNMLMLVPALYMLQLYDRVLTSYNETTLLMLTALALGLYALMASVEAFRALIIARLGSAFDAKLNTRVFDATFERSLKQTGANVAQMLHDLNLIRQTFTGGAFVSLLDTPWIPIYLAVIFSFDVWLGVLATAGTLLLVLLAWLSEVATRPRLEDSQQLSTAAIVHAVNDLRNAEVIEALGMLSAIRRRWAELHQRHLHAHTLAQDRAAVLSAVTRFTRIALQSLVLGLGAWLVLQGRISAGMMIAGSIIAGRALAPVESLIGNWRNLVSARLSYRRLQQLLREHPARPSGMPLPRPDGTVSIDNLSVHAPVTDATILRNITFSVHPGEIVAIVGPSAAGKSTLARTLVGAWPPASGKVRIAGAELEQWNKEDLGPHLGYLPQDVQLFAGSIGQNIARFGQLNAEDVIKAAQRAGMHETILRLAGGYNSPVGEAGTALSGGTRQRIGLARALYGNPVFVVLDEPNANLDKSGIRALATTLRDLRSGGCAIVMVTHHNGLLTLVDKVLVLRAGQMQTFCSREEFLAKLASARTRDRTAPEDDAE